MRFGILGALAFFFAACSGGGTGTTTLASAALTGQIYEVDGQTVDRSGVTVTLVETGQRFVTGPSGDFAFSGMAPGLYTLDFDASGNLFAAQRALAAEGEAEGPGEATEQDKREEAEDEQGRPVVEVTEECGRIEIRIALRNGRVIELSLDEHDERHAKTELHVADASPLEHVEATLKLRSGFEGEGFRVDVFGLDAGTVIELFLDDREGDGPQSIGLAVADADGHARYGRHTLEDDLPLGVASLDALAGDRLEVRLADADELILVGEVPDLPEKTEHRCDEPGEGEGEGGADRPPHDGEGETGGEGEGEAGHDGDRASHRGKALLERTDHADGTEIEGEVEIRCWPAEEIQRFRMVVEGLEPGDLVAFEIEELEDGAGRDWRLLKLVEADEAGRAAIDTAGDGGEEIAMPYGVESVKELIGLKVRVRYHPTDQNPSDAPLLTGHIPELVRD